MHKTIYQEPGKHSITLSQGYYRFECWGAQGGIGCRDGEHTTQGGPGAYASGYIHIGAVTTFFCFVGGKGGNGSPTENTKATGGYNGGGLGGNDDSDNDGSGGGGGATDIRTVDGEWNDNDSLESRIIVAAGGSGSAYSSNGAPGGDLNGYIKTGDGIDQITASTTNQNNGYELGQGENGRTHSRTPSSGSGGGYYGGIASDGINIPTYKAISSSGSSYVSGFTGCTINDKYIFKKSQILNGNIEFEDAFGDIHKGNIGNGAIAITKFISPATCSFLEFNIKEYCLLFILYR